MRNLLLLWYTIILLVEFFPSLSLSFTPSSSIPASNEVSNILKALKDRRFNSKKLTYLTNSVQSLELVKNYNAISSKQRDDLILLSANKNLPAIFRPLINEELRRNPTAIPVSTLIAVLASLNRTKRSNEVLRVLSCLLNSATPSKQVPSCVSAASLRAIANIEKYQNHSPELAALLKHAPTTPNPKLFDFLIFALDSDLISVDAYGFNIVLSSISKQPLPVSHDYAPNVSQRDATDATNKIKLFGEILVRMEFVRIAPTIHTINSLLRVKARFGGRFETKNIMNIIENWGSGALFDQMTRTPHPDFYTLEAIVPTLEHLSQGLPQQPNELRIFEKFITSNAIRLQSREGCTALVVSLCNFPPIGVEIGLRLIATLFPPTFGTTGSAPPPPRKLYNVAIKAISGKREKIGLAKKMLRDGIGIDSYTITALMSASTSLRELVKFRRFYFVHQISLGDARSEGVVDLTFLSRAKTICKTDVSSLTLCVKTFSSMNNKSTKLFNAFLQLLGHFPANVKFENFGAESLILGGLTCSEGAVRLLNGMGGDYAAVADSYTYGFVIEVVSKGGGGREQIEALALQCAAATRKEVCELDGPLVATITKSNANSCDGLEQWRSFFKRGEGMSSNTIVAGLEGLIFCAGKSSDPSTALKLCYALFQISPERKQNAYSSYTMGKQSLGLFLPFLGRNNMFASFFDEKNEELLKTECAVPVSTSTKIRIIL